MINASLKSENLTFFHRIDIFPNILSAIVISVNLYCCKCLQLQLSACNLKLLKLLAALPHWYGTVMIYPQPIFTYTVGVLDEKFIEE